MDPERTRDNLERLPTDLIDGLRDRKPVQHERRGWLYDERAAAFVTAHLRPQHVVYREATVVSTEWASAQGLDPETIAWLVAHPTEGAYDRD